MKMLAIGAVIIGLSCGAVGLRADESREVSFTAIERGQYSDWYTKEARLAARSAEEWTAAWKKLGVESLPTPPKVDFGKEMVIAVAMGHQGSSGYGIEVKKIEQTKDALIVHVKENRPPPNSVVLAVITEPYHIIRLRQSALPVKFVTE